MSQVPTTLLEAVAQAKEALQVSLEEGCQRVTVEFIQPEIALEAQGLALEFAKLFESYGMGLKIFFPDAGAAALARRDWGEISFKVSDIGNSRTPIDTRLTEHDEIFLVVNPSSVEVGRVEELCNAVGDRPVILLIPQLEDIAIVGIGYAARQIRERFLSILETSYCYQPIEGGIIVRSYPSPWEVWLQNDEGYELAAQVPQKPSEEVLNEIFLQAAGGEEQQSETVPNRKKTGILSGLQNFLNALNQ